MGADGKLADFELERMRKESLDTLKETLVQKAARFLSDSSSLPGDMGYNQIRNLVTIAQRAATPQEIKAFIDYQMGRDDKKKDWRSEIGGQPFGQALKKEIGEVEGLAEKARPGDREFVLRCLAQFFGYLAWRAKYLDRVGKSQTTQRNGGERRGGRR